LSPPGEASPYGGSPSHALAHRVRSLPVPLRHRIAGPGRGAPLVRTPGVRCPGCGAGVAGHVRDERDREERLVAVVGTALVAATFAVTAGLVLVEGALACAAAGAVMFYLARKTF